MYALKDIISKFLEKNPEISKQYKLNLCLIWKEVVGDIISNISYPYLLKDNTLEVLVKNTTWLNQLRLMKKDIINKLNDTVGSIVIEEIEFKLDKRKKSENITGKETFKIQQPVSEEVLERINQSIKNVKDRELSNLLKRIFLKSYTHQ